MTTLGQSSSGIGQQSCGSSQDLGSDCSPKGRGRHAHIFNDRESLRIQRNNTESSWTTVHKELTEIQDRSFYKLLMGFTIVLNVVMMVYEADLQAGGDPAPLWMQLLSKIFFLIYVSDLLLTIYHYRRKFCTSLINVLDAGIVSIDLVLFFTSELFDELPSLTVLRTFRILRVVKVLNNALAFRELYLMMQGLVMSLRSIAFGTAMIGLLLTVWSILAVTIIHPRNKQLFDQGVYGDCGEWCRDAFGTVMRSNLTFFQTIVGGDSWGLMAVPLITNFPETVFIIIPAFLMVEVGLLNVIAAVIVDRQHQARVNDESLKHAEHVENLRRSYDRLHALFAKMDEDNGGSLTLEELLEAWDSQPEFKEMLEMMDISKGDIPIVFEILDTDASGDVTYIEFVEKLHYIRHINAHTLLVFMTTHIQKLLRASNASMDKLSSLVDVRKPSKQSNATLRSPASFNSFVETPVCMPATSRSGNSIPEELFTVPAGMELQTLATASLVDDRWKPGHFREMQMANGLEVPHSCQGEPAQRQAVEGQPDFYLGPRLLRCNLPSKEVPESATHPDRGFEVRPTPDTSPMPHQWQTDDLLNFDGPSVAPDSLRSAAPVAGHGNPITVGNGGGYAAYREKTSASNETWQTPHSRERSSASHETWQTPHIESIHIII